MIEKCAHCRWFQELKEGNGVCRKNAPDCKGNFPQVKANDYCGDFSIRYSREKADRLLSEIANKYPILARNKKESEEIRYIAENVFRVLWNTGLFPTDEALFDEAFDRGKYVCYVIAEGCLVRLFCLTAFECSKDDIDDINYITLDELKEKIATN